MISRLLTAFVAVACVASLDAQPNVPYERIRNAAKDPGNWLTYSGNYFAHRHSLLTQINPQNVKDLKPAWVYQ